VTDVFNVLRVCTPRITHWRRPLTLQLDPNISVLISNQYQISQVNHQYVLLILNFTSLFISMQLYHYAFGHQRNRSLILISPPVPQKKPVLTKSSTPPASIPSQAKRVSTPIQCLHVSTPLPSSSPGNNVPTESPSTLSWPASGSNSDGGPRGLTFFRLSQTNVTNFFPKFMPIGKLPSEDLRRYVGKMVQGKQYLYLLSDA
jgi:hypothetical protein